MSAELNEVLDQLQHLCGTFRRLYGIVPYHSLFFSRVEAVMSLMLPVLGLPGAVPWFSHSINSLHVLFYLRTISSNSSLRENEWKMSQSTRIILRKRYWKFTFAILNIP